jgi:hypothetical protein
MLWHFNSRSRQRFRTLSRAGRIAPWTKADSVTRFDRVTTTLLP